jgi:aspartyl-tRNA(Asn)/glutamyl-tRNA(Gln) amidotransferase subunit A
MTNLATSDLSYAEQGAAIRAGKITSRALTEAALARISAGDDNINSFITVTTDSALAEADAADADFAAGVDKGPMQGLPYALKDIYMTKGIRTTCHSKLLVDNVPNEDCVVATKFKEAGGVMVGKTATHEFAFGGPSFDLPFPPARNPWNIDHIPGGSSSGSGAAVAAGLVRMAMGSDTGGSIRGPAAYCGTVGLKPTYGLVSRRGIFPLSFTLDHAGPLSWSVEDTAITMSVIAGFDEKDPASAKAPPIDFLQDLKSGIEGKKIALPRHFFEEAKGVNAETVAAINAAAEALRGLGAIVDIVTLPDFDLYDAAGRVIILAESYAIHEANLKSRPLDYGRLTHSRMVLGATLSAADLTQAFRARKILADAVNKDILSNYDVMITASALSTAPRFDEMDKDVLPAWGMQTMPFNLTGNPAMSMPTGFAASGLPLSMQIVGKPFGDAEVLTVGQAFEGAMGLLNKRPQLETAVAAE